MKKIGDRYTNNIFENIKHIDDYENEYWYARELQKVLEYKDWRNFQKVINKAVLSANNSVSSEEDWIVEINKPIKTGKGKEEIIKDYKLSRYICYLIVQNANLFRINQTKQKLLKDNVQGEKEAKDVHYEVGKKVRKAIADIGGIMPEEMPTPKKSLKELEKEKKKLEIKVQKKLERIK